jgi:hypothetical protein
MKFGNNTRGFRLFQYSVSMIFEQFTDMEIALL